MLHRGKGHMISKIIKLALFSIMTVENVEISNKVSKKMKLFYINFKLAEMC